MNHLENKFFSCLESRILENGELYARFQLGTFLKGQGLTIGNAIRRTLLTESPGFIVTEVKIQGINHEFANISGVQETIFDILLNLRNLVFTTTFFNFKTSHYFTEGYLKTQGPRVITAADLRLPLHIKCVNPDSYIATLNSNGELNLTLNFDFIFPNQQNFDTGSKPNESLRQEKAFPLHTIPTPVRKVNYLINTIDSKLGIESICLEIWTDGSLTPSQILHYTVNKITKNFYTFAELFKIKDFKEFS